MTRPCEGWSQDCGARTGTSQFIFCPHGVPRSSDASRLPVPTEVRKGPPPRGRQPLTGYSPGLRPPLSAHVWLPEAREPPHLSLPRPARPLTPDLTPGVDAQVLEAGCGLQLPHRGVDQILLERQRVPCELHRSQPRLQALQPPGRGRRGWGGWSGRTGRGSKKGTPRRYTGKRQVEIGQGGAGGRREGARETTAPARWWARGDEQGLGQQS